ncbi:MAG: FUSC family protein [Oscillospiraceae bacterium]|nr:FUSC family protein [Oscillospiraceae bacterium]MDE7170729.1 FUSC family protein [Oscillospiraceae bacterium]
MEEKNIRPMTLERRHRIGMRIIKTVIAVFLCGVLAFLRNTSALYSMFAALFCVQNSAGKTVHSSIDRVLGTLIGGVVGVVTVHTMNALNILHIDLLRYLLMSLLLIPVIELCLVIKKPGCAGMACMVIMCLVVDPGDKPAIDSIERVFETVVGVALACGIDVLLPYEKAAQAGTESAPVREDKPVQGKAQPPERTAGTPGMGAPDDEGEDEP